MQVEVVDIPIFVSDQETGCWRVQSAKVGRSLQGNIRDRVYYVKR